MNLIDCAPDILNTVLGNGGDFAEIFLEQRNSISFSCEDDKVERVVSGVDHGAGIRLLVGERTFYAHTNEVSADGLMALAKRVSDGVSAERHDGTKKFAPARFEAAVKVAPWDVPVSEKLDKVLSANEAARASDKRVRQVLVRYGDSFSEVTIANSSGGFWEDQRVQTLFLVHVVAAEGDLIQTGYEPVGGTVGFSMRTTPAILDLKPRARRS